jgi:hypothetical protein
LTEVTVEISDELDALISGVTLLDISYFEMTAARTENSRNDVVSDEAARGTSGAADDVASEIKSSHFLSFEQKEDGTAFRVSLKTTVDSPDGIASVRCVAEYGVEKVDAKGLSNELLLDFTNHIATMALVPYIRQGLSDITQRVFGSALLMPIIRRGELEFSEQDSVSRSAN